MKLVEIALVLLGLVAQSIGVVLMANGYTAVGQVSESPGRHPRAGSSLLALLASALVRGRLAKGTVAIDHLTPENRLVSLQGLALVGLGFGLQLLASLVELLRAVLSPSGI